MVLAKLFASPPNAKTAWENYKLWKTAQKAVQSIAQTKTDRAKQLAIHGNRFIENRLVRRHKRTISTQMAEKIHSALSQAIDKHFKDCYLAVLFKNAKKCELLSKELSGAGV